MECKKEGNMMREYREMKTGTRYYWFAGSATMKLLPGYHYSIMFSGVCRSSFWGLKVWLQTGSFMGFAWSSGAALLGCLRLLKNAFFLKPFQYRISSKKHRPRINAALHNENFWAIHIFLKGF